MQLPTSEQLRIGLRRWRELRNKTASDVATESRRGNNAFSSGRVTKWESGKTGINYKRLVEDILPAYQIEDFDTFIDFCLPPSIDDITVFAEKDFGNNPIVPGIAVQSVSVGYLNKHRTRLDRVMFEPGKKQQTSWAPHIGHEFLFVQKGAIVCEFAVEERGQKKTVVIKAGMAVAFPSALFHSCYNNSDTESAELMVAKPSYSGTAGLKPK
jgi:mannose-6-phosphate isomerase-like protein (cupin superfamily)